MNLLHAVIISQFNDQLIRKPLKRPLIIAAGLLFQDTSPHFLAFPLLCGMLPINIKPIQVWLELCGYFIQLVLIALFKPFPAFRDISHCINTPINSMNTM